jgi:hypothetical protein
MSVSNPPGNNGQGGTGGNGAQNDPILTRINLLEAHITDTTQGIVEAEAEYGAAIAEGSFADAARIAEAIDDAVLSLENMLQEYGQLMRTPPGVP